MAKRYDELDVLRGLAIIGVILIHVTSGLVQDSFVLFINQASRFAVPVFLLLSGLGLTISNKLKQGYFRFLWQQLSKILGLYLVWSIIYYTISSESNSIIGFMKGFVLGTNQYHLYYVPLIIFLYMIYPLLLKIVKNIYGLVSILVITVLSQVASLWTGLETLNHMLNVFNWLFYFALGIWIAYNFEGKVNRIKQRRTLIFLLFTIMLVVLFSESYFSIENLGIGAATASTRPTVILFSVLFVFLILSMNWKNNLLKGPVLKLAQFSYGIYLSHVFVLIGFEWLYDKIEFSMSSILYTGIAFIIVTMLSVVITKVMDKLILVFENIFKGKNKQSNAA